MDSVLEIFLLQTELANPSLNSARFTSWTKSLAMSAMKLS